MKQETTYGIGSADVGFAGVQQVEHFVQVAGTGGAQVAGTVVRLQHHNQSLWLRPVVSRMPPAKPVLNQLN